LKINALHISPFFSPTSPPIHQPIRIHTLPKINRNWGGLKYAEKGMANMIYIHPKERARYYLTLLKVLYPKKSCSIRERVRRGSPAANFLEFQVIQSPLVSAYFPHRIRITHQPPPPPHPHTGIHPHITTSGRRITPSPEGSSPPPVRPQGPYLRF
jgi:hypothetical protein